MSKDSSRKNGISSWCKLCRADSAKLWAVKQDKVELKRNARERYHKHFDHARHRNWALKHRYGITQDDYNQILKAQDFSCAICKRDSREMTYHLHTDHSHKTGLVRGLLCAPCNVYLGYIKDNPSVYKHGIEYLTTSVVYHKKKSKAERK
jgi:Recombination endonuclease VII